jgi:hypothetical protein
VLIDEAKALLAATGERHHEPELLRVESELTLAEMQAASDAEARSASRTKARKASATHGEAEALALLEAAVACARRQGSRMLELRATTALAGLCRGGAKAQHARAQLEECLAAVTEGADTADVRDARQLLG